MKNFWYYASHPLVRLAVFFVVTFGSVWYATKDIPEAGKFRTLFITDLIEDFIYVLLPLVVIFVIAMVAVKVDYQHKQGREENGVQSKTSHAAVGLMLLVIGGLVVFILRELI